MTTAEWRLQTSRHLANLEPLEGLFALLSQVNIRLNRRGCQSQAASRIGRQTIRLIRLQTLPHAHDIINLETDALVKLNHLRVRGSYLQIDLRTARLTQQSLGLVHDLPGNPALLVFGSHRQIINPPPVP